MNGRLGSVSSAPYPSLGDASDGGARTVETEPNTTVFRDYTITDRDGYRTIRRPNGSVVLAAAVSGETARRIVLNDLGEWSRW